MSYLSGNTSIFFSHYPMVRGDNNTNPTTRHRRRRRRSTTMTSKHEMAS